MRHNEIQDRLIEVLESAAKVQQPSQFFAWSQGPLQALLPHEIMICGMAEGPKQELRMRYFTSTRYFKAEHFEAACNPRNGLITQVINLWKLTRQPCLVPSPEASQYDSTWGPMLYRLELRNMASHGQLSQHDVLNAWFGFFRVSNMDQNTARFLEMLLPCITATYARMMSYEAGISGQAKAVGNTLTNTLSRREIQVLDLVRDGHSNMEIGEKLSISAMTAKNHLQNIRAKLKVKTRGQAVAESIHLGLIRSCREHDS